MIVTKVANKSKSYVCTPKQACSFRTTATVVTIWIRVEQHRLANQDIEHQEDLPDESSPTTVPAFPKVFPTTTTKAMAETVRVGDQHMSVEALFKNK